MVGTVNAGVSVNCVQRHFLIWSIVGLRKCVPRVARWSDAPRADIDPGYKEIGKSEWKESASPRGSLERGPGRGSFCPGA